VRPLLSLLVCLPALAQTHERIVESIVPWLDNSSSCWSAVDLQNLGNRDVVAEVEAHKSTGALVPLIGHTGIQMRLSAGMHAQYKLQLPEETTGVWVRVRETIPSRQLSPVLAVSGVTECVVTNVSGDQLQTTVRDIASPARDPWFSGDASHDDDGVIALINTSERAVRVSGCYSSGVLYSVPLKDHPVTELTPVCSETVDEQVAPFGSTRFPVARSLARQ
jgi:hypothetical protein